MSDKTRFPTANGVSRTLSKAKHKRATRTATRVRGYHNITEGFEVRESRNASTFVTVGHVAPNAARTPADYAGTAERKVAAYAETLRAEGYTVQVAGSGVTSQVLVKMGA